jgi:ribonuclease VapC
MVIDTSAILAILNDERDDICRGVRRASMVIENKRGPDGLRDFDSLVATARIEIVPGDERQARVARDTFRRYGKARHAAALNYGDRFTYAFADVKKSPILFKGGGFLQTDVRSAC